MISHEPYCDQRHPPRQRCNDALRAAPAVAAEPNLPASEPESTLPEPERPAPPMDDVVPDEAPAPPAASEPVPPEPPEVAEPASAVTASEPAGETNGASTATPLAETLRTSTLAGTEWQKSLASLERSGPERSANTAAPSGSRVPRKAIALAGLLASAAVLAAVMKRSRARRSASD